MLTHLLPVFAALIMGLLTYRFVRGQYQLWLQAQAEGRLADREINARRLGMFRFFLPLVRKSPLYDMASRMTYFDKYKKKIRKSIVAAGLRDQLDPDDIYGIRILLCAVLPAFLVATSVAQNQPLSGMILVFPVGCWFVPTILLDGIRVRRQKAIQLALPTVIDLLTLSTEAGLDFMGGLQKVVEKAKPSPFIEELEQVTKEIKLGASRADALRGMSERVDMMEITSFVAILVTADQMGGSIGKVLRAQSDSIRSARFVRAEKAGAKATQMMLFPLIFLILPAVFLIIFGPVVVSFFYGSF